MGLHARPASLFSAIAKAAPCDVFVNKPGESPVNGSSPLRLLTLAARSGDTIIVSVDTNDVDIAAKLFDQLIATITD